MRQFYFNLAERLGMTVGQLLDNASSRELAEWLVLQDLDSWKTKLASKQETAPPSATIIQALFGTAIKRGAVVYGSGQKNTDKD